MEQIDIIHLDMNVQAGETNLKFKMLDRLYFEWIVEPSI